MRKDMQKVSECVRFFDGEAKLLTSEFDFQILRALGQAPEAAPDASRRALF